MFTLYPAEEPLQSLMDVRQILARPVVSLSSKMSTQLFRKRYMCSCHQSLRKTILYVLFMIGPYHGTRPQCYHLHCAAYLQCMFTVQHHMFRYCHHIHVCYVDRRNKQLQNVIYSTLYYAYLYCPRLAGLTCLGHPCHDPHCAAH